MPKVPNILTLLLRFRRWLLARFPLVCRHTRLPVGECPGCQAATTEPPDRNKAAGCPVMGRTSQEVGVMPKEITYSDQREYVLMDDGSEGTPGWGGDDPRDGAARRNRPVLRRAAVVGWSREQGHVEIGLNALDVSTQSGSYESGMFATFDRDGINRLIRTLRKARDQAFGADA